MGQSIQMSNGKSGMPTNPIKKFGLKKKKDGRMKKQQPKISNAHWWSHFFKMVGLAAMMYGGIKLQLGLLVFILGIGFLIETASAFGDANYIDNYGKEED